MLINEKYVDSFWLDNKELCLGQSPSSPEVTLQNGKVISSGCIGMYYVNLLSDLGCSLEYDRDPSE